MQQRNLILGQILSICLTAGSSFHNRLVYKYGLQLEALEMVFVYSVVSVLFWFYHYRLTSSSFHISKLKTKLVDLLVISANDFCATILALKAYSYISLPLVALLSTISTPTVMLFSIMILKAKYSWKKIAGAGLSVIGVLGICIYDLLNLRKDPSSNLESSSLAYVGYAFAISSAIFYGAGNVLSEKVLKEGVSLAEFLALNSSFSSVFSICYLYSKFTILVVTSFRGFRQGRDVVEIFNGSTRTTALFLGYGVAMISFYSLMPVLMISSSAALLNLSLLTFNFYTIGIEVLVFQKSVIESC